MKCPNEICEGRIVAVGLGEQPAIMDFISIHNYFVCPWCGGEYWPKENKKGEVTTEDALACLQDEVRRQNSMRKKTSSRKAGRKRRPKPIITSWWAT